MSGVDVGLAFLEGMALIASPCILPVLPLVLSTSIDGGKARPFGIIAGFVLAFSGFVLLSRRIVQTLHVDPDMIRYTSLALLAALGLVLVSETLSEGFSRLTQGAADLGGKLGADRRGGFAGGVVIGALIGLVWTPCAGPILAAVLVQVIRQQTDLQGVFVTMAFAFGATIPMLAITFAGRAILKRFGFFARHAVAVRKTFGVLILASVAFLGFGASALSVFQSNETPQAQSGLNVEAAAQKTYPAPELVGIEAWLNSPPLSIAALRGKVVLVDFWTYSCINCVRTLPYLTELDRKYRDKGLVIIGVHAPEFEFEKNIDNIKAAVQRYGIRYPVAVDNNLATWLAYDNHYWPAHYLIDQNGQVVDTHFGEGDYAVTENAIRKLLGLTEMAAQPQAPQAEAAAVDETPETYLGLARAERFAGSTPLQRDRSFFYHPAPDLPAHHWSLGGSWKAENENITTQGKDAVLKLNFTARKVFLVLGTASGAPQTITVTLNGKPLGDSAGKDAPGGQLTVNGHALYELVNQPSVQSGVLELRAASPGLEAYAFTFGL